MTQQLQQNPRGENLDGQPWVTKYEHFYAVKPPMFEEAKKPLVADAWIKAIEAKFLVFVLSVRTISLPYSSAVQCCCGGNITSP
jgi:hypothetical protein